ncbi:MAG: 2OG-Fe(II) oxygenase, partial [Bdellovibrionales bacterium]|nr:2OG-Fe(II) oxygenase [Bdellovibrionales bacterium]
MKTSFQWPASTYDQFYPKAQMLRQEFEEIYIDPREGNPHKFSFEPWYIEDQFYHLKTPATSFFSEESCADFLNHLVDWGRRHLGCQMVSPPWLSLYLDGHFQNWHADNPQGPFAFVYTLMPKWSPAQGGRTFLLKPEVLNYWSHSEFSTGFEKDQLIKSFTPKFDRLLVFDPRLPHRVETVRGPRSPLDGRLVLHGWFTEPRPTCIEELSVKQEQEFFGEWVPELIEKYPEVAELSGYVCFQIRISSKGEVQVHSL